jgi:hypothetical protein
MRQSMMQHCVRIRYRASVQHIRCFSDSHLMGVHTHTGGVCALQMEGGHAKITLNNPSKRNALGLDMVVSDTTTVCTILSLILSISPAFTSRASSHRPQLHTPSHLSD